MEQDQLLKLIKVNLEIKHSLDLVLDQATNLKIIQVPHNQEVYLVNSLKPNHLK